MFAGHKLRRRAASGSNYSFEYTTNKQKNTTATSYTFGTTNIGTPNSDRMVIISVVTTGSSAVGGGIIDTLTVDGVGLTKAETIQSPFTNAASAIFYGKIPTGTTAAVVVTPVGQVFGCKLAVYAYNTTQSAALSVDRTTSGADMVIECVPDGVAIHASGDSASSGRTNTWSGIDPIVDDANTSFDSKWVAFSHVETTETSSVRAFGVTGGSQMARVGVSFAP
jgi:hypothetical protein